MIRKKLKITPNIKDFTKSFKSNKYNRLCVFQEISADLEKPITGNHHSFGTEMRDADAYRIRSRLKNIQETAPVTESKTHDTHLSLSELFQHKDHPVIHDMENMAIILAINNMKLGSNMIIQ